MLSKINARSVWEAVIYCQQLSMLDQFLGNLTRSSFPNHHIFIFKQLFYVTVTLVFDLVLHKYLQLKMSCTKVFEKVVIWPVYMKMEYVEKYNEIKKIL